jgi:hypothetical protein
MARLAFLPILLAPYVEALYPLAQVLSESEIIAEAVVEKVDATNKVATAKVTKSLKGKCGYETLRMNFSGGQEWHPEAIMKHVVVGQPMLIFYNAERRAEGYVNRFFFQLYGDAGAPPDKAWWTYTHIEIRMNRTFNGTVAELSDLVSKIQGGQAQAPAPNAKLPPISRDTVRALPAPGEAVDETALPAPFLKAGLARRLDPKTANVSFAPNDQGFLRHWLVLGPIPLGPTASEHTEAAQKAFFDKAWVPAEAAPRELEKVAVDGTDLTWEAAEAADWVLDFGAADNSLHIAVAYVVAEADLPNLTMLLGSDDGCRVRLNGKDVHRAYGGRGYAADQDRVAGVTLRKGVNVLQAWVINGGGPTGVGVRFVDAAGVPAKGLRVSRSPTPDAK